MRTRTWLVGFVLLMLAPPSAGQSPSTQTSPAIEISVAMLGEFYDPINDVRRHQVTLVVTCAVPHLDDPSYSVNLTVPDKPPELTVVTDVNPLRAAFEPADCLDTTNNTVTVTNNLTLSLPASTQALTPVSLTVNATLTRESDPGTVLAGAEGTISFTVGYVPGLAVDVPVVQMLLNNGAGIVNFTAHNRANGPTRVSVEVTEAPAGLQFALPGPFEVARGASQEGSIVITSVPPCPQRFRTAVLEFEGVSPTHPQQGASNKTAGLSLECVADSGGSPAPSTAALALALALAVAHARARWRRR